MWVDEQENKLPSRQEWPTLSLNHLIEVKNGIMDKIVMARGNPVYVKPLMQAVAELDGLISSKLNEPR